eukprot:323144_1
MDGNIPGTSYLHAGIFLDEVGLAEQSPHMPLKVLHQLLEFPKIWCIALSNWALDSAKMNRMVFHNCPPHDKKNLYKTATEIVESYSSGSTRALQMLRKRLHGIGDLYHWIEKHQPQANFFGCRDFYSLVKYLASKLHMENQSRFEVSVELLIRACLRNFGGLGNENAGFFVSQLARSFQIYDEGVIEYIAEEGNALSLIESNLEDSLACNA